MSSPPPSAHRTSQRTGSGTAGTRTTTACGWCASHHSAFTSGRTAMQSRSPANGIQSHNGVCAAAPAASGSAASAVTAVWFKTARSPAQNANNFFMGKPPCNQLYEPLLFFSLNTATDYNNFPAQIQVRFFQIIAKFPLRKSALLPK